MLGSLAWLAVSFSYRSEKKMIIREVKEHTAVEDLTEDPAAFFALPPADQQRDLEHGKVVAAKVAGLCMSRWDGVIPLRAKVDSNGKRSGIWMDKFETVRAGCMLLAFRRVNAARQLQGQPSIPAFKLLQFAWLAVNIYCIAACLDIDLSPQQQCTQPTCQSVHAVFAHFH